MLCHASHAACTRRCSAAPCTPALTPFASEASGGGARSTCEGRVGREEKRRECRRGRHEQGTGWRAPSTCPQAQGASAERRATLPESPSTQLSEWARCALRCTALTSSAVRACVCFAPALRSAINRSPPICHSALGRIIRCPPSPQETQSRSPCCVLAPSSSAPLAFCCFRPEKMMHALPRPSSDAVGRPTVLPPADLASAAPPLRFLRLSSRLQAHSPR